jgi:hypothetical protein
MLRKNEESNVKKLLVVAMVAGLAEPATAGEWVTERIIEVSPRTQRMITLRAPRPRLRARRPTVYQTFTHPVCHYAWKVDTPELSGGPSGICVPEPFQEVIEALAPFGSKQSDVFFREVDRDHFGSSD